MREGVEAEPDQRETKEHEASLLRVPEGVEPKSACMDRMRKIGIALVAYAHDHKGEFPDSWGALLKEGYLVYPAALICPVSGNAVPDDFPKDPKKAELAALKRADDFSDYVLIAGTSQAKGANLILAHEKRPFVDGGRCCLFVDGHVEWLADAEFQKRIEAQAPGEARAPEIAEVDSLEALRAVKPIKLGDGWEVQLGLADGGKDAGAWKLLYCLARYTGELKDGRVPYFKPTFAGQPLGPVYFEQPRVSSHRDPVQLLLPPMPREALYCQAVPTTWKRGYVLGVYKAGNRLIGTMYLRPPRPEPCQWQTFANRPERPMRKDEWPPVFVDQSGTAAMPHYNMWHPVWTSETKLSRGVDGKTRLPGQIETGAAQTPPLKLTLEKGVFVITSEVKLIERPEEHLLARWWVNGKPVVANLEDATKRMARELKRIVGGTKKIGVGFGLPANLGPLKAGDRVTLQVLYSCGGYRRITKTLGFAGKRPDDDLLPRDLVTVPLLSNRLEFVVTEAMLAREAIRAVLALDDSCRDPDSQWMKAIQEKFDLFPLLRKHWKQPDPSDRIKLLELMARLGQAAPPRRKFWDRFESVETGRALVEALDDADRDVREKATWLLGWFDGEVIRSLTDQIVDSVAKHGNTDAILLLGRTGSKRAVSLLREDNRYVLCSASKVELALAKLGDTEHETKIIREFEKTLWTGGRRPKQRLAMDLGYIGSEAACKALARELRSPVIVETAGGAPISVRMFVIEALSRAFPNEPALWQPDRTPRDDTYYEKVERWATEKLGVTWDHPRPPFFAAGFGETPLPPKDLDQIVGPKP